MQLWLLVIISIAELFLFFLLLRFFVRLRKSEALLLQLSEDQQSLMDKLRTNAELERELMQSFSLRQSELQQLNSRMESKAQELHALLEQVETASRSPQFLRELIIKGSRKGRTPPQLAKATGLSLDEVQFILAQAGE